MFSICQLCRPDTYDVRVIRIKIHQPGIGEPQQFRHDLPCNAECGYKDVWHGF